MRRRAVFVATMPQRGAITVLVLFVACCLTPAVVSGLWAIIMSTATAQDPCFPLADLLTRHKGEPIEEQPLSFDHLRPKSPVRKLSFPRSKLLEYLASGDKACRADAESAARLFAPLDSPAQVKELVERFEGPAVQAAAAKKLEAELVTRGFLAKGTALPPGGVEVEAQGASWVARTLTARTGEGRARLSRVTFHLDRASGAATREQQDIVAIAPSPAIASRYESGSPFGAQPDPALVAEHGKRLAAFDAALAAASR